MGRVFAVLYRMEGDAKISLRMVWYTADCCTAHARIGDLMNSEICFTTVVSLHALY